MRDVYLVREVVTQKIFFQFQQDALEKRKFISHGMHGKHRNALVLMPVFPCFLEMCVLNFRVFRVFREIHFHNFILSLGL
jgi:hypothetical protein